MEIHVLLNFINKPLIKSKILNLKNLTDIFKENLWVAVKHPYGFRPIEMLCIILLFYVNTEKICWRFKTNSDNWRTEYEEPSIKPLQNCELYRSKTLLANWNYVFVLNLRKTDRYVEDLKLILTIDDLNFNSLTHTSKASLNVSFWCEAPCWTVIKKDRLVKI